jgi:hypothetical protein
MVKRRTTKTSAARETVLGIRMTAQERATLAKTARLFPELSESALARIALLEGLKLIAKNGINLAPR